VREEYCRIWFVTNRTINPASLSLSLSANENSNKAIIPRDFDFDKLFSPQMSLTLHLGQTEIEFPADRSFAEQTYSSGTAADNPLSNFTITQFRLQGTYEEWLDAILQDTSNGRLNRNELPTYLMFVHGFNQNFGIAAATAAQLRDDLNFKGPMLVFSWPSNPGFLNYDSYHEAEERERISVAQLTQVIEAIDSFRSASPTIKFKEEVIAHSMGARLVLDSLNAIHTTDHNAITLKNLILAAPDVSRATFLSRDLPLINEYAKKTFITCSIADLALFASEIGGNDGKLGQCDDYQNSLKSQMSASNIHWVEFNRFPRDLAGHSYFVNDSRTLQQIKIEVNGTD
jgi:esterase/lipase superfamily enzyme